MTFFPPLSSFDPPYPIAPDGYLPNSVLVNKLRKSEADQQIAQQWQPPSLSDKQKRLMAEMKEKEKEEEMVEEESDSDLMARLQAALNAPVDSPRSTPSPPPPPSPPPSPPKVNLYYCCHTTIVTCYTERDQVTDESRETHSTKAALN